jgi:hypothetical protein
MWLALAIELHCGDTFFQFRNVDLLVRVLSFSGGKLIAELPQLRHVRVLNPASDGTLRTQALNLIVATKEVHLRFNEAHAILLGENCLAAVARFHKRAVVSEAPLGRFRLWILR